VRPDAEEVQVTVSARITPLGPVPLRIMVSAEAIALLEPAVLEPALREPALLEPGGER
jgi:hypothetical protein